MMSSSMQGQQQEQQEEQGGVVVVKSSASKCRDCGNQAKKDCGYSRCRTCCKNKGFQCQTHVRSTWIPVDRRRHRLLMDPSPITATSTSNLQPHNYDIIDNIPKRHKHNNPYSSEEMEFPAAMSTVAIFSCVRVRSTDDTVNEIAYQTSVNIGGHIFSGLLYDQGPDQQQSFNNNCHRGEGSTTHTALVHHHHHQQQQQQQHQQHNLNLMMMSDGATLPHSVPAAATTTTTLVSHEQLFSLPNSFRPDMSYFSQYPRS